jgi:hypothetical protein
MKRLKINKLILVLVSLIGFQSCVDDDDFNTPNTAVVEPVLDGPEISINAVAGQLGQEQDNGGVLDYSDSNTVITFDFDVTNQYLVGYVVSSDEGGNFFEEISLQDKPESPTIGIKLLIDVNPLFVRYEVGRKVYIKLNGLAVGMSNGVLAIGALNGNSIDKIPFGSENDFIFRSAEVATIVPLPIEFSDFSDDKTNLFVELQDVQFNRNQATGDSPLTYASEPSDEFDGERILESCTSVSRVVFSTSTFSDFKNLTLPSGRGRMSAILTKNFFGEVFNIVVNSPEDVNFNSVERCDPEFLECPDSSGGGSIVYEEDFQDFGTYSSEGWENINVSGTTTDWFVSSFSGNFYSRISAFSSGNSVADVWLITPPIDLDNTTGEELSFDLEAAYDNGPILSVYVSTDYTGDPSTATWQQLDAIIPTGPSGGFGGFESIGPINISCIVGTAVFGFFYGGSDPSATTRYHLDNIEITGN